MAGINVPIGPAIVEYGEGVDMVTFDITKGGIVFTTTNSKQDVTVDQYGDTVVKSIYKGGTAQVTVPFALYDLEKLSKVTPNSTYVTGSGGKEKLEVRASAGLNLLDTAKKLVIKPTDPSATANDWITIPIAGAIVDHNYAYDSDNERITPVTFVAYPDIDDDGLLFIMGDETATAV
ncbi:hypothetical protein [Neobacillus sp. 19]|uniref:hypothetical protein n=1 Tax=Neobacillus sp. 19 TaxID=3394458 RepID=UPI003BF6330A